MFSSPPMLLTIPVPSDDNVVEPLALIVNKEEPVEEAIINAGLFPAVPTTESLAKGVEVPMTQDLKTLCFHYKRPCHKEGFQC